MYNMDPIISRAMTNQNTFNKVGKVRKLCFNVSYLNDDQVLIETSDRLSANDQSLGKILGKGQILNQIGQWWFEHCPIKNHFQYASSPTSWICTKVDPIPLEFIVRQYLYGSMWQNYQNGQRTFWGLTLEDNMTCGQELPEILVTPTTKETELGKHDRPITKKEVIDEGILNSNQYDKCIELSKKIFGWGSLVCKQHGLVLVDTKYEFGLKDNEILLIDELHTPDSSRFWKHPFNEPLESEFGFVVEKFDKDVARNYLKNNPDITDLPEHIKDQLMYGYTNVYEHILRQKFNNLNDSFMITIIAGSIKDSDHCKKIIKEIENSSLSWQLYYGSAHKNTNNVLNYLNNLSGKNIIITVAGASNALSGVVACNCKYPVFACPPFKDKIDMMVNINSTLQMPSKVPVMTVLNIENLILCINRILG